MRFDRELWQRARPLFDELVALDDAARSSRLAQIGTEDPALRAAVERLLIADVDSEDVLRDWSFGTAPSLPAEATSSRDPLGVLGQTVSRFRVKDFLASGGMGVVYTAEDLQLGRVVALKFPLPHQQLDGSVKERFMNEARSAGALNHPNLCTVYEIADSEHGLFLVMPLYPGETLKDRLARDGALPADEALAIAQQVTTGLSSAHAAGIVHRDLKPGNVMLLPDGTVKVLDFGLAKICDVSLTRSRATLGTIGYVAPEQIRGDRVDARTDLWSIGVMLYEMLTGVRPFRGEHEISIVHGILHREPARPSVLNQSLSRQLDDLIAALLQKDAADRYPSADALLADIAGLRSGAALAHRSPFWGRTASRRRVRTVTRLPRWSYVTAAATLVVAAGGAAWQHGKKAATVPPVPVPPVRIAVLPFTVLGDSAAGYLAVGMSDALATDLAKLSGAIAPSYVTTSIYRATTKSVRQIAEQQQVRAVLSASVAHDHDSIHVIAQLSDSASERRLWSHRYDRSSTEFQEVERDILRAIVSTLGVHLTRSERNSITRPAAVASRAYDAYLRARAVELSARSPQGTALIATESIRTAQSLYAQARDLDPNFALARARLAQMNALAASTYDTTLARREQVRAEAQAALRLEPALPEANEALASYWRLIGDRPKAVEHLRLALRTNPHSGSLHYTLGDVLGRGTGRIEDALAEYDSAMQLEPGDPRPALAAGSMNSRLRRLADAMRALNRALAAAPDFHSAKMLKGHVFLRETGVSDTLAALLRTVPPDWDPHGGATFARFTVLWVQRRYSDGLAMLDHSRSELTHDVNMYLPSSLMRAQLQEALGERQLARGSYAKARSFLRDSLAAHPGNPYIRVTLALALAGLGRKVEAVREAHRAMDLVSADDDVETASSVMGVGVEVLAKVGETNEALDRLELLFSMHAGREVTVPYLRVWPGFDPLRSDPRFAELLKRFAADSARH